MELSELTAYAGEKFHIQEQRKWADFPGFSVLVNPNTGKWLALLMRQWDFDTGVEIQRCDIKCGQQILWKHPVPYLSPPFRMKGKKWVGVILDDRTDPEVVCRLFDRAFYAEEPGCTIVLDAPSTKHTVVEPDAPRPPLYAGFETTRLEIPEKIRQMQKLYKYDGGSSLEKYRNFYRQGKFMEDYEDDVPWNGAFRRYFPTYHDLNLPQLRGYFTWRTHVRKGDFLPIATSLAYLYIYELLNGIGANSPEDALEKMQAFEVGFLDSGVGDQGMRGNLRRWMLEYAVLHHLPPALARQYADPELIQKDTSLETLRTPDEASDEALFSSLCTFGGKKLPLSPVITKFGTLGKHLFAAVWRRAAHAPLPDDRDLFTACFGTRKAFPWHPLSNAVYWQEHSQGDTDYALDACRAYHCRDGIWQEERYENLYFDLERFRALLHESDRLLRKFFKTGAYLREKTSEGWATPYIEAVIQAQQQAEWDAARPKITLDFSHLEQIRQDASVTRDSLLTDEEMGAGMEDSPESNPSSPTAGLEAENGTETADGGGFPALDALHSDLLLALLRGESVEATLKAGHLMPSVAADTINEALFDEIGDNVLECDGNTITLVEDYRDDLLQLLGGKSG